MRAWRLGLALSVSVLLPLAPLPGTPVAAQNAVTRIYTLDQEQLFSESDFGKRVLAEINRRSTALAEENRNIEETLGAEEQDLTNRRPTLDVAEFRLLADEFDLRVEEIRKTQAQKTVDLNNWLDQERQRFGEAVFPVLLQLAQDLGASVILDRRSVIMASDQIDITSLAISEVNTAIGDGDNSDPQ